MPATDAFEIEITLAGHAVPFEDATHDSPAEGGYVEDAEIIGLGIPYRRNGAWVTASLLDGVDIMSPAIQRLFDNIMQARKAEIDEAISSEEA